MFKIEDYVKTTGFFSDALLKQFQEMFALNSSSRFYIAPGHIVLVTDNAKVYTCDFKPYDFSTSPNDIKSDELLSCSHHVLDISFDTDSTSTRMFIVLVNGDVQIFEYRTVIFEWARIGYFNLNFTSPNSGVVNASIARVWILCPQNVMYWAEKSTTNSSLSLHKREVPLSGVREITQSALGVPQMLLKNCPEFKIMCIRENIVIVPSLPNGVNVYVVISARLHVWLFHIHGKLLWRGVINDSALDFVTMFLKTVGLWHETGDLHVCKVLDSDKSRGYLIHNDSLLTISVSGEIQQSVKLCTPHSNVSDCFVMQNMLFIFTDSCKKLHLHSVADGADIQTLNLEDYSPISGIWHHASSIPSIGFYSKHTAYKLSYRYLDALLGTEPPCVLQHLSLMRNENFHVYLMLKDAVFHGFEKCDIRPLRNMPSVLQSEGLLLALWQSCQGNSLKNEDFPMMRELLFSGNKEMLPDTKLRDTLKPFVEGFIKLENYKTSVVHLQGKEPSV